MGTGRSFADAFSYEYNFIITQIACWHNRASPSGFSGKLAEAAAQQPRGSPSRTARCAVPPYNRNSRCRRACAHRETVIQYSRGAWISWSFAHRPKGTAGVWRSQRAIRPGLVRGVAIFAGTANVRKVFLPANSGWHSVGSKITAHFEGKRASTAVKLS